VVFHPQQQWRFQATWLFGLWLSASVGAAVVLGALAPRRSRSIALAAVALLAATQAVAPMPFLAKPVAIPPGPSPSDLELSAAYLPFLENTSEVGFVASFGRTPFFTWTTREHCRCLAPVDQPGLDDVATRTSARQFMNGWIASSRARIIVVLDAGD